MQCRACHQQTSLKTNLVDANWTVTVINQRRLPPMLLMTLHITPPAHRRPSPTPAAVANGHKGFKQQQ